MTARQGIFAVRGSTRLSAELTSILPTLAAQGRKDATVSQRRRSRDSITTTFCPSCGGNKMKKSLHCANCRNTLMRQTSAEGRKLGLRVSAARGASKSLFADSAHRTSDQTLSTSPSDGVSGMDAHGQRALGGHRQPQPRRHAGLCPFCHKMTDETLPGGEIGHPRCFVAAGL